MDTLPSCPRCGQADPGGPACPRCGVIFSKLRARPAAGADAAPASDTLTAEPDPPSGLARWLIGLAALGLVAGGGSWWLKRPAAPASLSASPQGSAAVGAQRSSRPAAQVTELPPPELVTPVAPALPVAIPTDGASIAASDRSKAEELLALVRAQGPVDAGQIKAGEELFSRYPDQPSFRSLLGSLLLTSGAQERSRRRLPQAAGLLQRAASLQPDSVVPLLLLIQVDLEAADWAGAEAAARSALLLEGRNADALQGLAYALYRQDRNREAADAAQAAVEIRGDSAAASLLARIKKGMADERGMTEQHLSHFHVRYDGEAHEDVGREILRALERHYSTLAGSLDYQPATTIPVILFSREGYYTASGAPAWSGGVYDTIDGRIRIPIGGLGAGLSPEMDQTLIHELTHAFLADRSRGVAPREIHEGLAQYMEGKRVGSELSPEQLTLLADGRVGGVYAFYLGALSFVEYLVANRGLGGMNELAQAMGETGSVDEAFRRVHGQTLRATKQAWAERFRQQHGS